MTDTNMESAQADVDDFGNGQQRRVAPRKRFSHRLYTGDFAFNFVGRRKLWYTVSAILIALSLVALLARGLNLGIEFKGGSVFTVPTQVSSQTLTQYQQTVREINLPDMDDAQVNTVGDSKVRVQTRSMSTDEVRTMREVLGAAAQVTPDDVAYQLIGPSWGSQVTQKSLQALIVFLVLVALLIGVYFRNWKMSAAALVALAHDLIITVGVYALSGFTFTPTSMIGVLTILGYSLYDTVVVFDIVRENTRNMTRQDVTYSEAANTAVNQALVRSINTTIIAVLPVVAILIAGVFVLSGQGPLADLGLALFIGMVVGAYSSIFLAAPLLAQLKELEPEMVKHRAALEKRRNRPKPRIETVVAPVDKPIAIAADVNITAAAIPQRSPVVDEGTAKRPQPKHTSRSERRK